MKLVLLKIGGCLITDKNSEEPLINQASINQISSEISRSYEKIKHDTSLIIIHGAGSYGHPIVKRTGIHEGVKNEKQLISFAETQRLQNELNNIFCKALISNGVPAIPIQASATSIMKNKRLISMHAKVIKGLINIGMIPVLYGVPAFDAEQKCSILSGDQIMTHLGREFNADKLVFATDVNGVYTADPKKDGNARMIKKITRDNINDITLSSPTSIDVTGGMLGKINELINTGINAQIINGELPGNINKALLGEDVGTTIDLK